MRRMKRVLGRWVAYGSNVVVCVEEGGSCDVSCYLLLKRTGLVYLSRTEYA